MTTRDNSPWQDAGRNAALRERTPADELLAPKTQLVADRDDYLGQGRHDIGRRISDDQVELFIAGDIAASLQAEIETHAPEFITLHDLGTSASLRLLSSLAGVAHTPVQRLAIRRQGHGVALAVLQFVELKLADGTALRVYSSDLNVQPQSRAQVARVLLGHSRMGVLLVGELAPHMLATLLAPLAEALQRGAWPNRELLMLPLGGGTALATHASQLGGKGPVAVHVTPHAVSPRQAWSFIGGAWNRIHADTHPDGRHALPLELTQPVPRPPGPTTPAAGTSTHDAPTQPMALAQPPAPLAPPPRALPVPGGTDWATYVERCHAIKGSQACCVFDIHARQLLAVRGGPPEGERLLAQGMALLAQVADSARALGMTGGRLETSASTGSHHLVVRGVPGHSGVYALLLLSARTANLTLARMQIERVEPPN